MTDTQNTDVLEIDDALEEFPGKEDLKDRLVAIWVTGKHGRRQGTGPGAKPYDWYETVTLVLDDGPNWDGFKIVDGEKQEMLVPSVAENGPQRLDNFQFSQGGMTKRLEQRVFVTAPGSINGPAVMDKPRKPRACYLGRINSRKNSQAGFNASWSISTPTEADHEIAKKYAAQIKAVAAEMEKLASDVDAAQSDDDEFND